MNRNYVFEPLIADGKTPLLYLGLLSTCRLRKGGLNGD